MKLKNLTVISLVALFVVSFFVVPSYADKKGLEKFKQYMEKQNETLKKGYSVDCYLGDNKASVTKISKKGSKSKFSYGDGRITITYIDDKTVVFKYYPQYKSWIKLDYIAKGKKGTRYNNKMEENEYRTNKYPNLHTIKTVEDFTKFYDDIKYMKDEKINGYDCAVFVLSPIKEYEDVYDKGEIVYLMKSTGLEICTKGTDGYVMNNINVKVGLQDSEFNIPEDAKVYGDLKEMLKNNINK